MRIVLRRRGFTLIELMITIAIIAILAAILIPNFKRARAKSQLTTCMGNCKNLATALELYATDYNGHFPSMSGGAGLQQLIDGGNLKRIPTCPAAGAVTFLDFQTRTAPDAFSFSCVGTNHETALQLGVSGYPQYSNERGLTAGP